MPKLSVKQSGRAAGAGTAVMRENAAGGTRKMRSPIDHQLAVPVRNTRTGTKEYVTSRGTRFITRKL
jgi:hypothetical protein